MDQPRQGDDPKSQSQRSQDDAPAGRAQQPTDRPQLARQAAKRGGGWLAVPLDEGIAVSDERLAGLIALDEALSRLSKLHPRQSEVIELRFFGGLGVEETATILQVSPETVMLDWRAAKAWLHKELHFRSASRVTCVLCSATSSRGTNRSAI